MPSSSEPSSPGKIRGKNYVFDRCGWYRQRLARDVGEPIGEVLGVGSTVYWRGGWERRRDVQIKRIEISEIKT